eukprot:scaffold87024_cov45-Phaeocystis_antarctica.AAC.1
MLAHLELLRPAQSGIHDPAMEACLRLPDREDVGAEERAASRPPPAGHRAADPRACRRRYCSPLPTYVDAAGRLGLRPGAHV